MFPRLVRCICFETLCRAVWHSPTEALLQCRLHLIQLCRTACLCVGTSRPHNDVVWCLCEENVMGSFGCVQCMCVVSYRLCAHVSSIMYSVLIARMYFYNLCKMQSWPVWSYLLCLHVILLCIFRIWFPAAQMGVFLSLFAAFVVLAYEIEMPMWAWAASCCVCICCPCPDAPDEPDWDGWENIC